MPGLAAGHAPPPYGRNEREDITVTLTEQVAAASDDQLYLLLAAINEEIAARRLRELRGLLREQLSQCWFLESPQKPVDPAKIREVSFRTLAYENGYFYTHDLMTFTLVDDTTASRDDIGADDETFENINSLLHEITIVLREQEGIESVQDQSVLRVDMVDGTVRNGTVDYY